MSKSTERGSALIYILIAIALLAALTATFMDSSSQQTSSQNTFDTVTDLNSQVNFIRSTIQECALTYPSGDTSASVVLENAPYPLNPLSSYLSVTTPVTTTNNVSGLRCPGNPGNSNAHTAIFGGASGKFLPPKPKLFTDWSYYNGVDGVFFYTSTTYKDAYLKTALDKLDDQFSECEADVITDTTGGFTMVSSPQTSPVCPQGSMCFRVWIIAQPSNVYKDAVETAACP